MVTPPKKSRARTAAHYGDSLKASEKFVMSGPTIEPNPRIEVVVFVTTAVGKSRKLHVKTFLKSVWGAAAQSVAQQFVEFMKSGKSKAEGLEWFEKHHSGVGK